MDVIIRKAVVSDIRAMMTIFQPLDRIISFHETRTWMRLNPEGFFVAETDDSQIVGTCCGIRLSPDEGYLGLIWVAESFRSRGIGTELGRRSMQYLGDRNVCIRGRKECAVIYTSKYGFPYVGDRILRLESHGCTPLPERMFQCGTFVATLVEGQLMKIQSSQCIADEIDADTRKLTTADIVSKVEAYDRSLRHIDLSPVVREMFFWQSCKAAVALSSGKVVGYGCLRPVVTGQWVVSPLYADSESVAEVILFDLLLGFDFSQTSKGILVRYPAKNTACIRLMEKFGFRHYNECACVDTVFTKHLINQDTSKNYSYFSEAFCTE